MELALADTIIQRLPASSCSATKPRLSFSETDSVVLDSVTKRFRHRPALFNWLSREQSGETRALVDVSLRVQRGKVLVLLGPNGSGKTTTLKLISTMLLPDSGRVLIEGADTGLRAGAVRNSVGFAVANERSFIPRLSARENLDFFASLEDVPAKIRRARIQAMLERSGLQDAANTLVMKFSSGMYQRLGIARALIKQPSVMLLDEPTRSLDPASTAGFWNLVRELADQGATVILATHSFQEAVAIGDFVAVLHCGRLAACHKIRNVDVEELRSFYFQATGELDHIKQFALRNCR
jgi:ABC-2 type transport system ATP-binding protein